jgi:hypothetical protein
MARRAAPLLGAAASSWTRAGSGMMPEAGESLDSIANVVCMSVTFPRADHQARRPSALQGAALPSLGTTLSGRAAERCLSGGALREIGVTAGGTIVAPRWIPR